MRKKILIAGSIVIILICAVSAFYVFQKLSASKTEDVQIASENDIKIFSKKIDMSKWQYNADDHVYYQLGIPYCATPTDKDTEKLAIFVPEQFFTCQQPNNSTTYSCKPTGAARIGELTIHNAPIIIPIEAPEYQKIPALTAYKDVSNYTKAGFIYVHVGSRGIESAAPAAVTDFKAAIRFLRYNKADIPANTNLIFVYGADGGGTLSAILGTSGDNSLYQVYLQNIGAIESTSDVVYGVLAWNALPDLGSANSAYEWSMGFTRKGITQNQHKLSNLLAREYVNFVNKSGFIYDNDSPMFLQYSDKGIYKSGPYYDYVKHSIERSLSYFLWATPFPYTPPHHIYSFGKGHTDILGELDLQGTFQTMRQYIKAVNGKRKWVEYQYYDHIATIRSMEDFMHSFKPASLEIGSFDTPKRSSIFNMLLSSGDGKGAHFDETLAKIYKNHPIAKEYTDDLVKQDALGVSVRQRRNMYSPLYYIVQSSVGYRTSKVAPYWRLRYGLFDTETDITSGINLALAVQSFPNVQKVDFENLWMQKKGMVEQGDADPNETIIKWILEKI